MAQHPSSRQDSDERYATLLNNAQAVRTLCSAVEGTLGPKGLDVMLVGAQGDIILTNDGVTILDRMDVTHPVAKLVIQVARAQQQEVGDGTTTATVLAGALVEAGVQQVMRGVPAAKVVAGIQQGIAYASQLLAERSIALQGWDDSLLRQAVYIAGREQEDIVQLVLDAGKLIGWDTLKSKTFRLADTVEAHELAENECFEGLLLKQKPLHYEWLSEQSDCRVLVLQDGLVPEELDEQLLSTEAGFQQYMQLQRAFMLQLEQLKQLGVGLIVLERSIHPEAEQFCFDHEIMVVQRVSREQVKRVAQLTGAKPLKRTALSKAGNELEAMLGQTPAVRYDERLERVRLYAPPQPTPSAWSPAAGAAKQVTMLVGASTREIVGERARIAADAASALQAAIQGGILPGGGTAELAVSYALERYRETVRGMEAFGIAAVAEALRKPMAQVVLNAGYNPLEKLEEARAAQTAAGNDAIGIDCDTGALLPVMEAGIVDPARVKLYALRAAGEVAAAVLRIHTVIKMRDGASRAEQEQ
ncbi:TCP-1/cpn60 chaperonin family protein [Paenibacillus sp. SC116]|uniref:TCP-1/cpn60 chaperonin family protein n=1 Tax=Paenibacillus sp. SC116 TaxID=2968986 RepID=UPI00215ABD06|nr:TCP-1/cpn60 chaperonin family protein [Paenibacillus sp. SC116]MCR8845824.1 TCP-1/cpn60 chaperonin family protein [Paenibacillus sp. SC116]